MIRTKRFRLSLSLALVVCAAGCAGKSAATAPSAQQTKSHSIFANIFGSDEPHGLAAGTGDPAVVVHKAPIQIQQLDIHVVAVPLGSVSRSDEFWKRVDEMNVDPATHDLLFKNGIRVGIARSSEWTYFKGIIDQYPAKARNTTISGANGGAMQMEMKKNVPQQNIFYFDDENVLRGRTYDKSDNLMGIAFVPAPRKPETVRVSICPTVRSVRKEFKILHNGDEREISYSASENMYHLNLETDVPIDSFLVLAPSSLARWNMSIGASFLVEDGITEKFEQVILLVPR